MIDFLRKLLSPFNSGTSRTKQSESQKPPSKASPSLRSGDAKGSLEADLGVLTSDDRAFKSQRKRHDALIGAEVRKRLEAGHAAVVIEPVADDDVDFVPADRLLHLAPVEIGEPIREVRMGTGTENEVVRLRPGDTYPVEAGAVISHPAGLIIHVAHADGRKVVIHPVLS